MKSKNRGGLKLPSYSIYVDEKQHMEQYRRKIKRWVDDDSVTKCNKCDSVFSYMVRKHHCRICGKIYCYNCSSKSVIIPLEMLNDIPKDIYNNLPGLNTKPVRSCDKCDKYIKNFQDSYDSILWMSNMDIETLKKCITVFSSRITLN